MGLYSIITNPANGSKLAAGTRKLDLRGASWAGDNTVKTVDVSTDYGAHWKTTNLAQPKNKYDWQRWTSSVDFPSDGYYEIWVRATDSNGAMSPIQASRITRRNMIIQRFPNTRYQLGRKTPRQRQSEPIDFRNPQRLGGTMRKRSPLSSVFGITARIGVFPEGRLGKNPLTPRPFPSPSLALRCLKN